jgi:serine/threonine protein kinase
MTTDSFQGRLKKAQSPVRAAASASTLPSELASHPDYQVIRELGRGGMGVVYLAENELMGRKEVLKVVSSQLLNRQGAVERFHREIRSAAQLHHPNIVTAYSAARIGESIVFSMEYVEGHDLAKFVEKNGPLPVAHACNFVYQAALGLQHAHERGMVHRDIKPSNLMLARDGNRPIIKILDFGLAKVTSEGAVDGGLTHEGQMLGTPHYVAPEQTVNPHAADIRADIYSLGCTFYCLLAGHPPFDAPSLYELLQAHHSMDAKPLNFVRPEVPVELAALVAKMLAKETERRFQTPAEVAQALIPFFKKGRLDSGAPKPEASRVSDSEARYATACDATSSTQPRSDDRKPLGSSAERSRAASPWENLIEARDSEAFEDSVAVAPGSKGGRPRWFWPAVAVAGSCALIALGVILGTRYGGGVETNRKSTAGPLRVSPAPPKVATSEAPAGSEPSPRTVWPDVRQGPPRLLTPAQETKPAELAALDRPKVSLPAPSRPLALKHADRELKSNLSKSLGFRLEAGPTSFHLTAEGKDRAPGYFWPELSTENSEAWLVGDRSSIRMTGKGLVLEKGTSGNFLITRRNDFEKCSISVTLAVAEGAEIYLALRAHQERDIWHAVTSRITAQKGKVYAGSESYDFQAGETTKKLVEKPTDRPFLIRFLIDEQGVDQVFVGGQQTSSGTYATLPMRSYVGRVGIFVKSGKVLITELNVPDK